MSIEIEEELYNKLNQISEITGISMKKIVNTEIKNLFRNHMRYETLIFLDRYLGIENIKDPISIVKKLQPIINISDNWIRELETLDPVKYIKKLTKLF